MGGFEFSVLQRNLKELARKAMEMCFLVLKESNKSRFDSYRRRNSVLIISHIAFRDCRVHIFSDNLSRNSCILKRISKHTGEKGPVGFNLEGFDKAVLNLTTGLALAAHWGERKQSVPDAARMLSFLVAKFLHENSYEREGKYVEVVAGGHEAADGRGLIQLECCKRNYAMLNIILDEWLLWHVEI